VKSTEAGSKGAFELKTRNQVSQREAAQSVTAAADATLSELGDPIGSVSPEPIVCRIQRDACKSN
jgi:hypothetical protein